MSNEQYQEICKERFDEIIEKIDSLDKKLFHDNGNECLQTKINSHAQLLKTNEARWKYMFGIVSVIVIGLVSRGLYLLIAMLANYTSQ